HAQQNVGRHLALDTQVPVVDRRNLVVLRRIPAQIKAAESKRRVRRRRERSGKQIRLRRAALQCLRCGKRAQRVGQRPWYCSGRIGQDQLRTERRLVHETVVEDAGYPAVVENTRSTADAGLAVAKNVIRKSNARREILEAGIHSVLRNSRIAREVHAWRRIGELCRSDVGQQSVQTKLLHSPLDFPPRKSWFIAQSEI